MTHAAESRGLAMTINEILAECERQARIGWEEIEDGMWTRDMLPDQHDSDRSAPMRTVPFTEICPEKLEEDVIDAMVRSGRWHRGITGFNLRLGLVDG